MVAGVGWYGQSVAANRTVPATLAVDTETARFSMVRLTGGMFEMGSDSGYGDELPIHSVTVGSFEISRTEVTVAQYRACVDAGVCAQPGTGASCNWDVPPPCANNL